MTQMEKCGSGDINRDTTAKKAQFGKAYEDRGRRPFQGRDRLQIVMGDFVEKGQVRRQDIALFREMLAPQGLQPFAANFVELRRQDISWVRVSHYF